MSDPQTSGASVTDSFCVVASPIHASRQDTTGTLRQIEKHNLYGREHCGWNL
jgi:hypothetical protein